MNAYLSSHNQEALFSQGIVVYCCFGEPHLICRPEHIPDDPMLGPAMAEFSAGVVFAEQFLQDLDPWRNNHLIISALYDYLNLTLLNGGSKPIYVQLCDVAQAMTDGRLVVYPLEDIAQHPSVVKRQLQKSDKTRSQQSSAEQPKRSSGADLASPQGKSTPSSSKAAVPASSSAGVIDGPSTNTPLPQVAEVPEQFDAVAARQQRYQQRKTLIADTRSLPGAEPAAQRLDFNNDNIVRAEAAQYVYRVDEYNRGHIDTLPEPPVGLKHLNAENTPELADAVFTDNDSGFGAALFESDITGEKMLTFRGTNNGVTGAADWKTNFMQGSGMETTQYNQAMELARRAEQLYQDDVIMVGHSLGGGLATSGVAVSGNKGYTFNSSGLHPKTSAREQGLPLEEVSKLIVSQAVDGDVLTMAQSLPVKGILTGAAGYLGGPVAGLATAAAIAGLDLIPKASGDMRSLPSLQGGTPIDRHGMDQVVEGIESQKQEDINTLNTIKDNYLG